MLILREMGASAAGAAIIGVAVGLCVWVGMRPVDKARTIPTGAGFSIAVTRTQDGASALQLASTIEASGLPAFTRPLNNTGSWLQVVVGPFVSIEEAEQVHRSLTSRGFGVRLLVDESVRRRPGHDGVPLVSTTANLVLVSGAGRLSLVVEMPGEPRQAETRRVTPTLLEVDIGPVSGPVAVQHWQAPQGVSLIQGIWTQEAIQEGDRLLRIRLAVSDETLSNARILGRRLYIDLWSADMLKGRSVKRDLPVGRSVENRQTTPPPVSRAEPELDYREMIAPTVARLETVEPFVLAAVAAPSPDVLNALSGTMTGLKQWLNAVEPPAAWAETHRALVGVVSLAISSLEPAFIGNRAARAQEAFALFDEAKVVLQTNQKPPTTIATAAPATIVAR